MLPPTRTRKSSVSTAEQIVLNALAEEIRNGGALSVDGVVLRQKIPGEDRNAKTALVRGLIPDYAHSTGPDSFMLTWLGAMNSQHGPWFGEVAEQLHAFLRLTFEADPNFQRYTWEDVQASVRVADAPLEPNDLNAVSFLLTGLGSWGQSGTVFSRPPPPQLEDLLEIDDTPMVLERVQAVLFAQQSAGDGTVSGFDTQQVCLKGHRITADYHTNPEQRQDHCSRCGAPTLFKCPACGAEIRGRYHDRVMRSVNAPSPPAHCHACGEQFPWAPRSTDSAAMAATDAASELRRIVQRFHVVATQLRTRHDNRSTLLIKDEYDAQDLLHALLRVSFDDVRAEEHTPSYAGRASRIDFLLKREGLGIEVKVSRQGLRAKDVGDQLIEDIARYQAHPNCNHLVCLVYDPDGLIANPRGLEDDLGESEGALIVEVFIVP